MSLSWAVIQCDARGIREAVTKGENPNILIGENQITPLMKAAIMRDLDLAKFLINKGASPTMESGSNPPRDLRYYVKLGFSGKIPSDWEEITRLVPVEVE